MAMSLSATEYVHALFETRETRMSSTTSELEAGLTKPRLETPTTPIEAERILLRTTTPSFPGRAPAEAEPSKNRISEALRPAEMPQPDARPIYNRLAELAANLPNESRPTNSDEFVESTRFPMRAMLPEAAILAAIAIGWLWAIVPFLPPWWQSPEVMMSIPGAYGLFLTVKWLFLLVGGGYQLTARQILRVNPGPIPDPDPIELATIAAVAVEQSWMDRLLFVGRIRLIFERDSMPALTLGPIGLPKRRAQKIQEAVAAARGGNVIASKAA